MTGQARAGRGDPLVLSASRVGLVRGEQLLLVAIVGAGGLLRLYDLGRESFSLDEGISLSHASALSETATDIHAPLYYLLLLVWTHWLGTSEQAVRGLSVLAGTLSILTICRVGARWFQPRVGLVAALLLSLSTFHLIHSRNGRMYEVLVLFSLVSMYWFVRLVREGSGRSWLGYVVSTELLGYTHAYGWLVVAAQWAWLLSGFAVGRSHFKPRIRSWLAALVTLVGLYAPWLWQSLTETRLRSIDWIPAPTPMSPFESLLVFASGSRYLAMLYGVLALSSVLVIESLGRTLPAPRQAPWLPRFAVRLGTVGTGEGSLLLFWLCLPFGLALLVSALIRPVYQTHYLAGASVALYLAVAVASVRLRPPVLAGVVLALVVLVLSRYAAGYYGQVHNEQWREAAGYVDRAAIAGDLLVFESVSPDRVFDRYSRRPELHREQLDSEAGLLDGVIAGRFAELSAGQTRVWLIQSHSYDETGVLEGALRESHVLREDVQFVRVRVRLFEVVTSDDRSAEL